MCGIVGFVNYEGRYRPAQVQELTLAMRDAMTHRGPDDAGLWLSDDGVVCLGHRRLSIVDLRPEGRQPMLNEDKSVAVTFNGEIYNYQALTTDLLAQGHRFVSRTDTEALCHLFEGDPAAAIERLEGMFAFGIWRSRERELVLARDPFGKKPLYYAQGPGFLAFASELRCLEVIPGLCGTLDDVGFQKYLLLQYVHAPDTIYKGVHKLEPGSMARFRLRGSRLTGPEISRFFRFTPAEPGLVRSLFNRDGHTVEELRRLVVTAVKERLMGDVPLGAFLSGGVDSATVVAVMVKELGVRPRTFSIGFTDTPESEHLAAREVSELLGTDHHELILKPSAIELLPTIADALDEPNGDTSCLPVYLLSEFTRRHVTVALSGDGGDELFGGYTRYGDALNESHDMKRYLFWLRKGRWWNPGHSYVSRAVPGLPENLLKPLTGPLLPEVQGMLDLWKDRINTSRQPLIHRLRHLDVDAYMPGAVLAKVDRMSMRFALEVRCPLLDVRLARWAMRLPAHLCHDGKTSKVLLKRLAARYLPEAFVNRRKMGFGLPMKAWSHDLMMNLADDLLLSANSQVGGRLERAALKTYLARQRRPESFSVFQVWGLMLLEQWLRTRAVPATIRLAA